MLFGSVLFNLLLFGDFLTVFLLFLYSILLWFETTLCMMSILLNLLTCVLYPRLWYVLVNVLCELEKSIDSNVQIYPY